MAYYVDFVGLNTFIYEVSGWTRADTLDFPDAFLNNSGKFGVELHPGTGIEIHTSLNHIGQFTLTNDLLTLRPQLGYYKNYDFPLDLPHSQSFFPALMIHRNGPYGWPSWKQLRTGQNPLTRKQIKNNIFTHVEEPGSTTVIQGATVNRRYGDIKAFIESPIISRYKPVMIRGASSVISERTGKTSFERFTIKSSFGNNLAHFNNEELDKYYNFINKSDNAYDEIKDLYLEDGLDSPDSPMDIFEFVRYSETVYPPHTYANKNYTRQRTTFSFDWRDSRVNRTETDDGNIDNGFGSTNMDVQSIWPLDVTTNWATGDRLNDDSILTLKYFGLTPVNAALNNDFGDAGILQNVYSSFSCNLTGFVDSSGINSILKPAPFYLRRHMLTPSASVVSPNGMTIEGINSGTSFTDIDFSNTFATGEAKWEAGDQAGKNPFYDSYDDYVQGVRQRGKGYTIIPEFRISNHIPSIVAEGVDKNFTNMFEMVGGLSTADGSDEENFYKIYSTSDFLKHFDVVKEDHKGFVDPVKIKLKCKAIKKFLPYNGFYPCQRTVEIAKQFYSSHANGVTVATGSAFDYQPLADATKIGFQNLLAPLFAPGVLFNTIKSGVACDYPIVTSSVSIASGRVTTDGTNYYLSTSSAGTVFDKRIPFNALVEPQRYLAQTPISCNEPHVNANHSSSAFWDGTGDNLYKMMAHNFLAEVPDFFLQGQQFSTIYSKPSNDPNVGNAVSGSTYKMRVKMYKSSNQPLSPTSLFTDEESFFTPPQYDSNTIESFTMYSRPSAFGPPFKVVKEFDYLIPNLWPPTSFRTSSFTASYHDPDVGENYAFTPPYYYGQSWADIEFTATQTKKYTIEEIIRDSNVTYYRHLHPSSSISIDPTGSNAGVSNGVYNSNAMQLSASVNLFAQGEIKITEMFEGSAAQVAVAVDASDDNKSRWIIQPYFETPMLNFNHLSTSTSLTLPTYGSQSVPRGMWHQYGRIETDTNKGIFLQVTNVPNRFRSVVSGSIADRSLVKLCGFKNESKRLGQVAHAKVISEAVVAIPFIEEDGQRKFFKLGNTITAMKSNILDEKSKRNIVGDSIFDMVDKMKKFVIPPSLDFIHRKDIDPFAMYIFEFKHTLNQQDLADIWQNLPPTIGRSFEEATATISHPLLASELLGGGDTISTQGKKKGPPLPDKIQWMVFKAKQRAETNYYDKIVGEMESTVGGTGGGRASNDFTTRRLAKQAASMLRPENVNVNVSYNWPYDFFSLVELVKIDAEVTLSDSDALLKEEDNIVIKRGVRGIAGLPARAQKRIQSANEDEDQPQINIPRPGGF